MAAAFAISILALAAPALAQPWASFGGDAGRSGHQPADSGVATIRSLYARTGPEDQGVVTSVTTTGGPPGAERIAYGTADGRVHIRQLLDGAPVGPKEGIDLSDRPDPFGSTRGVGFATTSNPTELGQLFVVHNGPAGTSVAQFDEATGDLVQRVPVVPDYSIRSSPLLSPPLNGGGDRALMFVAIKNKPETDKGRNGAQPTVSGMGTDIDGRKLFKVTVTRAQAREAHIGPVTDAGGIRANPDASPSLVYLTSNNGATEPYVAVATSTGRVVTYSIAMLAPGPHHSTGGQDDRVMTPAVPVTPSGLPPGMEGSGAPKATQFFAASTDGQTTILHRLTRPDSTNRFAVADSPRLPGAAAVGLATSQFSLADGPSPGLVYVTTAKNLYALDANNLTVQAQFNATELAPGTGFAGNAPSVTGNLVFVTRDNGEQLALDAHTLRPVPVTMFRQDPGNGGATASFGQPSLSHHRQVFFASDKGVFVYRMS